MVVDHGAHSIDGVVDDDLSGLGRELDLGRTIDLASYGDASARLQRNRAPTVLKSRIAELRKENRMSREAVYNVSAQSDVAIGSFKTKFGRTVNLRIY